MNLDLQAIRNRRRDDQDIAALCDELERLANTPALPSPVDVGVVCLESDQIEILFQTPEGRLLGSTRLDPEIADRWADSVKAIARQVRAINNLPGALVELVAEQGIDPTHRALAQQIQARGLGATGEYPAGKISPDDEGALNIAIGQDDKQGVVVIEFGTSTRWVAMEPGMALEIADLIQKRALILQGKAH